MPLPKEHLHLIFGLINCFFLETYTCNESFFCILRPLSHRQREKVVAIREPLFSLDAYMPLSFLIIPAVSCVLGWRCFTVWCMWAQFSGHTDSSYFFALSSLDICYVNFCELLCFSHKEEKNPQNQVCHQTTGNNLKIIINLVYIYK